MPLPPPPVTQRYPTLVGGLTRGAEEPPPIQASVQVTTAPPTSGLSRQRGVTGQRRILDWRFDSNWQMEVSRYVQVLGVANFAANVIADTCARCDIQIEERKKGSAAWEPTEDTELIGALDEYRGEWLDQPDLVRAQAFFYETVGECAQVVTDRDGGGVWFGVYDWLEMQRKEPRREFPDGSFVIPFAPNASVRAGTAMEVDAKSVWHMWVPDPKNPGKATSPFRSSLGALRRLWSLLRYAGRIVDHPLSMNKMMWTPSDAHKEKVNPADPNSPSRLQAGYDRLAARAFEDDDSLAALAPPMIHYDGQLKPPEVLDLADPLDEALIAMIEAAYREFSIGLNFPASFLMGGGVGQDNHWSNWLTDQKFWESGPKVLMDRITHYDLTRTVLVAILALLGRDDGVERRIGYDPSAVIVQPDHTELDLKLYEALLLKGDRVLESANWSRDDRMEPDERAVVLDLLSKGRGETGTGWTPSSVASGRPTAPAANAQQTPPSTALSPGNRLADEGAQAARAAAAGDQPTDAPIFTPARATTLLSQINQVRQGLGRKLLAGADTALAGAMAKADSKIQVRSRRREVEASARQAALDAVRNDAPRGPHLAAVGVTEADLLDNAFDAFGNKVATPWLRQAVADLRRKIEDAGFDPDRYLAEGANLDEAIGYLQDSLRATAWQRLGAHHPFETTPGEVSGAVPANIVRNTIGVLLGELDVTGSHAVSALPTVSRAAPAISEQLGAVIGFPIGWEPTPREDRARPELAPYLEWTWVHGYYGDPVTEFPPHTDLGWSGFATTAPGGDLSIDVDPALTVDGSFPESDYYFPGDHDGCTCEYVPHVVNAAED